MVLTIKSIDAATETSMIVNPLRKEAQEPKRNRICDLIIFILDLPLEIHEICADIGGERLRMPSRRVISEPPPDSGRNLVLC
jgi:hypothetical protein